MMNNGSSHIGTMLKSRRLVMAQTLSELATASAVSASHIGRIERGERFPSASVLRRVAKPLGLSEVELFTVAGYFTATPSDTSQSTTSDITGNLDGYVASVLAAEPVSKQCAIIGIFNILKAISNEPAVQTGHNARTSD